jgi:hypothetical protein
MYILGGARRRTRVCARSWSGISEHDISNLNAPVDRPAGGDGSMNSCNRWMDAAVVCTEKDAFLLRLPVGGYGLGFHVLSTSKRMASQHGSMCTNTGYGAFQLE